MAQKPRQLTFTETITAAVADMSRFGYSSQARVDRWMKAIKAAAEREMVAPEVLRTELKRSLGAIYRSQVDQGGLLATNKGVERFTLKNVKPKLRAELDRRIMASAQLIKLNRTTAINDTLQRFSGWATSIPLGGSDVVEKVDTKQKISKSLKQLSYEERRVIIDQGHKFVASLNSILATNGNAIAFRWHSRWRQKNYDYREDHKERDTVVYTIRNNWAIEKGLMKATNGYSDEITAPGEEVFCRCSVEYIYSIEDLPKDMLTSKGIKAIQELDSDQAA